MQAGKSVVPSGMRADPRTLPPAVWIASAASCCMAVPKA